MSDTTDPTTGFTTRNSFTREEWDQALTAAREAAQSAAPTAFGTVGQGAGLNTDDRPPLDLTRLNDHAYWTQNKAQILAAAAAGELSGQPNSTDSLNN